MKKLIGVLFGLLTVFSVNLFFTNQAFALTPPLEELKIASPVEKTIWQVGNTHTISWKTNSDNPNIEAFFETKKGKTFQTYAKLLPCGKGSIIWCGGVDESPKNTTQEEVSAKLGSYYLSIVDKVTGQSTRTQSPIKLVKIGEVIKLEASALDKDKKLVEGKDFQENFVTLKERKISLNWKSKADTCRVQISPRIEVGTDGNDSEYQSIYKEYTVGSKGKQTFNLGGNISGYYVFVICGKDSNSQVKQFNVSITDNVKEELTIVDVTYQPSSPVVNEWITTNVVVKNNSTKKISGSKVNVQGTLTDIPALNPGEKTTVTVKNAFSFSTPGTPELITSIVGPDNNSYGEFSNTLTFREKDDLPTACTFTRDLALGSTGADVTNLQNFLISKGFLLGEKGDTAYFGVNTQAALAKYQASVGISPANGYFGVVTRVKIGVDCTSTNDSYIKVLSPDGGETYVKGKTYTISWNAKGVEEFDIVLDARWERGGPDQVIARNIKDYSFTWTVPQDLISSDTPYPSGETAEQYKIFVLDSNGVKEAVGDYSDNYFNVVGATTTSPLVEITSIRAQSDGDESKVGVFTFDFKVTALDKDIFIPNKVARFDQAGGVSFEVFDANSNPAPYNISLNSNMESSIEPIVGDGSQIYDGRGYFKVEEGKTETFNSTIFIGNVPQTNAYRVKLYTLTYSHSPNSTSGSTEVWFATSNLNTRSNALFIEANPLVQTSSVIKPSTLSNSLSTIIDLELGMAHPTVVTLQKYLNSNGYVVETIAGQPGSQGYESNYFGEKTKQALIKYQKDKGIMPAWGFYGPQTRIMMGI